METLLKYTRTPLKFQLFLISVCVLVVFCLIPKTASKLPEPIKNPPEPTGLLHAVWQRISLVPAVPLCSSAPPWARSASFVVRTSGRRWRLHGSWPCTEPRREDATAQRRTFEDLFEKSLGLPGYTRVILSGCPGVRLPYPTYRSPLDTRWKC